MNSGLRAFLREFTGSRFAGISQLVEALNRTTCEICPEEFWATLFYAEIDPLRHRLQYVNAGHEPALLVRVQAGRVHRLESTGTVLGLTSRTGYRQRFVKMEPGDVLVAFTDGVLEPAEDRERQLRETNILDIMRSHPHASAHELVARIMDAADRSRQEDDRTVAVVRLLCAARRPLFEARAAELAFAAA
jgi:phosphoserine phosphatase RsbU/P